MSATFELHTPTTGHATKDVPTEYVRISNPPPPPPVSDEVFRRATDEDKVRYPREYAAFKKDAPKKTEAKAEAPPVEFMPGFADDKHATKHHKKG